VLAAVEPEATLIDMAVEAVQAEEATMKIAGRAGNQTTGNQTTLS
jgi:hypothetical protein